MARPLVACALASAACGGATDTNAVDPTVAQAEGKNEAAMCKDAYDRENPLIVEWPGTEKVALESISKRGLVVVSFKGCRLQILPRCEVKGSYAFQPVTVHRDLLEINTFKDLYTKLPVGSTSLKGELNSGKALKLDYVLVGQQLASSSPEGMNGDCNGATHYVRTISVGAYDMQTTAEAGRGSDVNLGIVEAGGHSKNSRSRFRQSGDVSNCAGRKDIDENNIRAYGCTAPVQLGLAPMPGGEE